MSKKRIPKITDTETRLPNDFSLLEVRWQDARQQLLSVRFPVFVHEQMVPEEEEVDAHDHGAFHVLITGPTDVPAATGRLVIKGRTGHIGRMAVLKEFRGMGLGAALMHALTDKAVQLKLDAIQLSAQVHAVGFYETFGFTTFGDVYPDAGIPHIDMKKRL